jgi:hypothetical protein
MNYLDKLSLEAEKELTSGAMITEEIYRLAQDDVNWRTVDARDEFMGERYFGFFGLNIPGNDTDDGMPAPPALRSRRYSGKAGSLRFRIAGHLRADPIDLN